MFSAFASYSDIGFAEAHSEILLQTPEGKMRLSVIAADIVDSNTEKQAAKDIREAKKNGIIDQFFYGSMTAEYLMDQIYAM